MGVTHDILIWASITLPIWLSPILAWRWKSWTKRPWLHFILINALVFPAILLVGGVYGLVLLLFWAWPVLIIGVLVSAMSIFRDRTELNSSLQ